MRTKVFALASATAFATIVLTAAAGDLRVLDAVKSGAVTAVRAALQQGAPVSAAAVDGSTALHEAVRRDALEIVNVLLGAHADVNAANRYNITPLALACAAGN